MLKTLIYTGAVALTAAALVVPTAPQSAAAGATARDGTCQSGEFCLYYNSNQQGSVSDFDTSISDYGASQPTCYEFRGTGAGQGVCVKNHAASVRNLTSRPVTVYYNSGYAGSSQTIGPGAAANLNAALKNENASHKIGESSKSYAAPRANPYPAAVAKAPRATSRAQFVDDEIARLTGEKDCWVGGYRDWQPWTSNHNTGNALDCVIPDHIGERPTAEQRAQGWKLAKWLRQYATRLQIRYVIFDGKIWSAARSSEGWRPYTEATNVTGGHYDHVHVSIQNRYGD
jgi:hypothetical protein